MPRLLNAPLWGGVGSFVTHAHRQLRKFQESQFVSSWWYLQSASNIIFYMLQTLLTDLKGDVNVWNFCIKKSQKRNVGRVYSALLLTTQHRWPSVLIKFFYKNIKLHFRPEAFHCYLGCFKRCFDDTWFCISKTQAGQFVLVRVRIPVCITTIRHSQSNSIPDALHWDGDPPIRL